MSSTVALRIGIINHPPLLKSTILGNEIQITGVLADLWKYLAKSINTTFRVTYRTDDDYGFLSENGSWSGAMGTIQRDEVDVLLGLLYPTYGRTAIADFSSAYAFTPSIILSGIPRGTLHLSFTSLFNLSTMVFILLLASLVTLSLVVFGGLTVLNKRVALYHIIWEFSATLLNQGKTLYLVLNSQKIVSVIWIWSVLMVICQVSAHLNANLSGRVTKPIDTLIDIIQNKRVTPIIIHRGFYREFFRLSDDVMYKEIWRRSQTEPELSHRLDLAMEKIIDARGALIDVSTDVYDFVIVHCHNRKQVLYVGKQLLLWTSNLFFFNKKLQRDFVKEINNRVTYYASGHHYVTNERIAERGIHKCFWTGSQSANNAQAVSSEDVIPILSLWILGCLLALGSSVFEKLCFRQRISHF